MDLMNCKITVGEMFKNPRAKIILRRNLPELRNTFLLHKSLNMSLENALKLARGCDRQEQMKKMISDLKAI